MNRIWALARRYPIVAVTVLVGLVVGGLLLSDDATAAQWLASGFALIIALQTSIRMIKDLLRSLGCRRTCGDGNCEHRGSRGSIWQHW